jgi:hypothetical protein
MWPAIANFANDYTKRLEERARTELRLPAQRNGSQWVARSLRGTGIRLIRVADRLEESAARSEAR